MSEARDDFEARWKAIYEANAATLAEWAAQASGGVFTIETPPYDERHRWATRPSLVRADGKPLGYHDGFRGERSQITGIQLGIHIPSGYRRLTRRDRKTMVAIRDAIRKAFYGSARWDDETYAYLRADYDRADVAMALSDFEVRNHLEGVKA